MEDSGVTGSREEGPLLPKIGEVRYFFHKEHEHPLILAESTEIEGREGTCCSCRESSSGLTYSCSKCGFYLHKLCTGRPDVIGNPLHPHPLHRDFCTGSRCSCCGSTYNNRSNFYKCLSCDFSLAQKCALAMPSLPENDQSGFPCQLCHTAMLLIEKADNDQELCCSICHGPCSGPTYNCPSCKFFLHESCFAGLSEIEHPSHPFHALARIELCIFKCSNCLEDWYSTSYRCDACDFDLDFKCAFLVPREEYEGKEPILMDIHRHPLELTDESTRRNGDCIVCYKPCSQSTYGCRCCDVYVNVHKSCAVVKIPKILHHTLYPNRPLQRSFGTFTCNSCLKHRSGYYYELSDSGSDFKIDTRCTYLGNPVIVFDGHSHPIIFLEDFDGHGMCDACGKPCTAPVFHCPTCGIKFHLSCGPLPCSIKQEIHLETLVLKDSHVEDWSGYEEFFCDSCEERRDPHECVYYCVRCNYSAEIKCVMPELKHALTGKSGDVELRTLGRWYRSGRVLSKGLLSEEMQQNGAGGTSVDTKPGCCVKEIIQCFTEEEKMELDNVLNGNEKLFEDLSGDGDGVQGARPYSDEEFTQLVQKLDSVQLKDLQKSWESNMRFVHVGEYLVPERLVRVYDDLYRKYGDLTDETTLSPRTKAMLFLPLCQAVEGICSMKTIDITESDLIKWWISIKAVRRAGFKIQFAVDALKTVLWAYYGLLFRRNLDREIRSLEEEVLENRATLEKLEGQFKHHKEYFESKEPSLVKECMEEASSLMYKTAGEVVVG